MKTRNGFVSNSSSSSFILELDHMATCENDFELKLKPYFKKHKQEANVFYDASEWRDDSEAKYHTEDVRKFLFKMLQSKNMKPLNKWILEFLWDDLRHMGMAPWNMFGLPVAKALEIMRMNPDKYDEDIINLFEDIQKNTTVEEQSNLMYVIELGNEAEFNWDTDISYEKSDYELSYLIHEQPMEMAVYQFRLIQDHS